MKEKLTSESKPSPIANQAIAKSKQTKKPKLVYQKINYLESISNTWGQVFSFFFFFFGCTHSIWNFLVEPEPSSNLPNQILNPLHLAGDQIHTVQRQCLVLNPLHHSRNSKADI